MKLEARTKEFYRSAFQSKPQNECLLQNQIYIFECILEILDRLDWRGSAKKADPTKFESHKPIVLTPEKAETKVYKELPVVDGRGIDNELETVVRIDRSKKATATGESDFKEQAKKITKRAMKNIEEEPL